MLEIILTILLLTIVIIAILAVIKFTRYFLKSNTTLNRLLLFTFLCFVFGFAYDLARIGFFMLFGGIYSPLDQLCFNLKIFLLFMGVSSLLRIFFILCRQGGMPIHHESAIRYFYYGIAFFLIVFNVYFYEKIALDGGVIYIFQIHPITFFTILITYGLLLIFVIFKIIKLSHKIYDKNLAHLNLFFGILVSLLTCERYTHLIMYSSTFSFIFGSSLYGLLIDFSIMLIMVLLLYYYLFFGKIDLLESISTYFCLKTLYLIKKDSGHIFYEHEFRADASTASLLADRFLLGGFLYAITQGLELGLGLTGNVDIIQAGKTTLLLRHGKFVFGLLFTLEYTQTLEKMVRTFMDRFEQTYAGVFENWDGDLSPIKMDQLNAWTIEIFKRF